MTTPAQRIRDLLGAGAAVLMPGVHDALSARIAADAGFEVLFLSGFAASATRLGLPDLGYLTQTDMADVARNVCPVAGVPTIVDTGYGNALSAARTARLLHAAGAAGIFLEDQEWPKRCGHLSGKRVVEREEWLTKLRAVLDLRAEGVDLFLVARTDARAAASLDEAIARACAARDLGVDAIFVEAPRSVAELERVAAEVAGAVRVANMIEGGRTPLLAPAQLHEIGHNLIVSPLTGLFAAAKGMREAYAALRAEGTLRDRPGLGLSFSEFEPLVRLDEHRRLEERYRA